MITNRHTYWHVMQAGAATSQLQREPNHLAKTIVVLSCGEAERPKVKGPWVGGIERRKNWPERGTGSGRQKSWKRTQEEEGGAEGGRAVFMVVEKSSEATVHAPSLIKRPLNPEGQTPRLRLYNI
jgi:hypothetical protein